MASKDWSDSMTFITTKSSGHKSKELGCSKNAKIGHAPQASGTTQCCPASQQTFLCDRARPNPMRYECPYKVNLAKCSLPL